MSDKTMDLIQKLLNQAAGAGTDAERETFQAKADQLMHQHQIDEVMLRLRNAAKSAAEPRRTEPTDEMIDWVPTYDEFRDVHMDLVSSLARLAGVRLVFVGFDQLHVVGYPQDISYFRMLWVSTHLTFSGKLFPKWEPSLNAGQNIRALAESGIKWLAIWEAARRAGQPLRHARTGAEIPAPPADNGWMKRQMAAAYAAEGMEKPKLSHGVRNYRDSFAVGFQSAVSSRCYALVAARRERENAAGDGVSLVLATDANAIEDYFNSLYPPGVLGIAGRSRTIKAGYGAAAERGAAAGRSVDMTAGRGGVGAAPRKEIGDA